MANLDLQNRAPSVTRTPDFRNHVERRYDVLNWVPKTPASVLSECWLPLGTVDEEYTDCYLLGQVIEGQNGDFYQPCKFPPVLVRTFEQLNGLNETQIGQAAVIMDQYGNQSAIFDYWQLAAGTSTYQIPGFTPAPIPFSDCILKTEERTNNGTLIQIKRTFINAGELSDNETLKFGGKLLLRELTYLNQIPPTPTGWTLITTSTEYIRGLPIYKYGFVSGNTALGQGGLISTETAYDMSPDQGATGITVTTLQYITDTSISSNPTTGPVGSELISIKYSDEDGYRLWTVVYASGTGVVASSVDTKEGGKLVLYSKTSINAVPSAPSPTIGGTVVLLNASERNGTRVEDGTIIYEYSWAEGEGLVSENISSRQDGLREVTDISIGTRVAPAGIVIRDEYRLSDGYTVFTVTAIQADDGDPDPTTVTLAFERYESFTYPGRALPFVTFPLNWFAVLDVYESPPVQTQVKATVTVTYQTSNALGSISNYWAPNDWATVRADWIDVSYIPLFSVKPLYGYRAVGLSAGTSYMNITETIDRNPVSASRVLGILGPSIGGSGSGALPFPPSYYVSLTVQGGPADPGGSTWTLDSKLEPAFTGTDGTVYYRRTQITAAIPVQPALPPL